MECAFFVASNEVITELKPTAEECHLLIGLKGEGTLKKTPEKQNRKRVVETVPVILSESLLEYYDAFDVGYPTSS